jgi:hypothetical protein
VFGGLAGDAAVRHVLQAPAVEPGDGLRGLVGAVGSSRAPTVALIIGVIEIVSIFTDKLRLRQFRLAWGLQALHGPLTPSLCRAGE